MSKRHSHQFKAAQRIDDAKRGIYWYRCRCGASARATFDSLELFDPPSPDETRGPSAEELARELGFDDLLDEEPDDAD